MKRLFSLVLIFSLLFGVFIIPNFAAEENRVIIHYQRDDGNYEGWNIWLWPKVGEGNAYDFSYEDEFGKIAIIDLADIDEEVGFIIRLNEWESKDVSMDRIIITKDGFAEIWVYTDQEDFYYEPPEGNEVFNPNEAILLPGSEAIVEVVGEDSVSMKIHYHRFDGNYEGWNIWLWPDGKEGAAYQFNGEDEYGVYADIVVPDTEGVSQIGYIVRLNDWEAKDVDSDRYVKLNKINEENILEMFLVQSVEKAYHSLEEVDLTPKFLRLEAIENNVIYITTTIPIEKSKLEEEFYLMSSENEKIFLTSVDAEDEDFIQSAKLSFDENFNLSVAYVAVLEGFEEKVVDISHLYSSESFENEYTYEGGDLGAIYSVDETRFKVWAPTAISVALNLYKEGNNVEAYQHIEMDKEEKGIWSAAVAGDMNGVYYTYSVDNGNGFKEAVDPYAKAVGVNGMRAMVVNLDETNPTGWENDSGPQIDKANDAIIYELHVRDISSHLSSGIEKSGEFLGLIESGTTTADGTKTGLDHLKELGITHIQILPFFDYRSVDETTVDSNSFNWGYDPVNYNAPDGSYSSDPYRGEVRVIELKETIKKLHDENIGIIMDVVYNHTALSANSHLNNIVPGYYYRMNGDAFSNGSGCGNETASERSMARKMIIDSVVYWAEEYHVDGFRFDLMGLHDIETMTQIRLALEEVNPDIIIYGEGWTGGSSTLAEKSRLIKKNTYLVPGVGAFNDDMRDGVKGDVFQAEQPGFVSGKIGLEESVKFGVVGATDHQGIDYALVNYSNKPWAINPSQSINYVSAHDNLTLWDKLSATSGDLPEEERIKMQKLANGIVLTSQGVPFMHAGVDFLRSKDGDHNSYKSSDSINQLNWDEKTENIDVFNYYRGLIEMRKAHPAFRLSDVEEIQNHLTFFEINGDGELTLPTSSMVGFLLNDYANGDESGAIITLYNGNESSQIVTLPEGDWSVIVNDKKAGTDNIEVISGKATVQGRSMLVLTKDEPITLIEKNDSDESNGKDGLWSILGYIGVAIILAAGYAVFKKKKNKKRND